MVALPLSGQADKNDPIATAPAFRDCDSTTAYTYCLRVQETIARPVTEVWPLVNRISNMPHFFPDFSYESTGSLRFAADQTYTVTYLPANATGIYQILEIVPERRMVGKQLSGPLRKFKYDHQFRPAAITTQTISDETVYYTLPYGLLGRIANFFIVKRRLKKVLLNAHKRLKDMAESLD